MGIVSHLIEAIRIMDKKGRRAYHSPSYLLWEKDWDALRNEIFQALTLSPEKEESTDRHKTIEENECSK